MHSTLLKHTLWSLGTITCYLRAEILNYVVFIDDSTRFTCFTKRWLEKIWFLYLLLKVLKDDPKPLFTNYKNISIRWWGKFSGSDFMNHLESCGLIHQFSCPNTLEQNGVVERKHEYIVKAWITLKFHAHFPIISSLMLLLQ